MPLKTDLNQKYIELLKKSLVNELYIENEARIVHTLISKFNNTPVEYDDLYNISQRTDLLRSLHEVKRTGETLSISTRGPDGSLVPVVRMRNFTELAHTMIGTKRLDNIQYCIETVLDDKIPGDFIETGIWRGGACIFACGLLAAYGVTDRIIWAADSFEGVPKPTLPEDANFDLSADVLPVLAVGYEQVKELFNRYGLLDEKVKFLKGWFKDTLQGAPIEKLSVLRLDGDLYESTMDALNPLYNKVQKGGFIIVDDYLDCPPCKRAVDEFREKYAINDPLITIDKQSVYWRKL